MCMPDKSRDAWPEAIADDDAFLLCFDAKSSFLPKSHRKLLYQRTTRSSKRITMCSTNIPARTQMQLSNSGRAQSTYLEKYRMFNQILGSSSRIAQKRLAGNPDLPATAEMLARYNAPAGSWSIFAGIVRPKSRGRIRLTGPSPMDAVQIETNMMSHPD